MAARPTHYAELTSTAAAALRGTAIALLPVGAVEPHGPHAPLGTDTLISTAVCDRVAERLASPGVSVVVLPPLAYGVTDFSRDFAGSVGVSVETLEHLVGDLCRSLESQHFAHRYLVNSHFEPAHVAALRRAAEATGSLLFDVTRRRLAERLTDEFRTGAAHAGSYETSMVLALRPELVDTERMRTLPELRVDMPAEMRAGKDSFTALGMSEAYCGNPAGSSAAEGERTLDTLATMLIELIQERVAA